MSFLKKSIPVLILISILTHSSTTFAHRGGRPGPGRDVDVVYVGSPLGLSTVLCILGEPIGCGMLTTLAGLVTTLIAVNEDEYDREQIIIFAKNDAKDYLFGEEMTPVLQEAIQSLVEMAQKSDHPEIAQWSTLDLAATIYLYRSARDRQF